MNKKKGAEAQRLRPKRDQTPSYRSVRSSIPFWMEYSAAVFFIAVGQCCMSVLGIFDAGYMIPDTYGGFSM